MTVIISINTVRSASTSLYLLIMLAMKSEATATRRLYILGSGYYLLGQSAILRRKLLQRSVASPSEMGWLAGTAPVVSTPQTFAFK